MSDYTPTTAEVRQAYAAYMSSIQNPDWSFEPEFRSNQDRFDRWFARHDAEVAAKALRDFKDEGSCGCHLSEDLENRAQSIEREAGIR